MDTRQQDKPTRNIVARKRDRKTSDCRFIFPELAICDLSPVRSLAKPRLRRREGSATHGRQKGYYQSPAHLGQRLRDLLQCAQSLN